MQVQQRERIRAGRLAEFKASAEFASIGNRRLDVRADDDAISSAALWATGLVKATIAACIKGHLSAAQSPEELAERLDAMATRHGAKPCAEEITIKGRAGRMLDVHWWRRNLRRETLRENENEEHAAGNVRRKGQCYVSDHAVHRKAKRAKINRETLGRLEVCNEEGTALNLLEVSEKSISNPKLRRAELMTRCRGFEETAKFSGHDGLFITLTCPSRFHKFTGGKINPNWKGATVKDGQKYLCDVWKKVRAAWNRAGFFPYGFRVAEPHHDGCPHWHILLFVAPEVVGWFEPTRSVSQGRISHHQGAGVVGIAGKYAMQDNPFEAGAMDHRFTCKRIDPAQGSATGYIAKYISKNIDGIGQDGESVGLDYASGTTAAKGAARVKTWAQVHSIRQFQQIGGPSVTVWRELRKVKLQQKNDLFEMPRAAADNGMWSLFWVLQGGPEVARKDLSLKTEYATDLVGKYGEKVARVWGVTASDGCALQTRTHEWTVQRAGLGEVNRLETLRLDERALIAGAEAWAVAHGFESASAFRETSEAFSPWTRVNNCTESDESEAERLDFERGAGLNFQGGEGKPPFESHLHEIFLDRGGNAGRFGPTGTA